MRTTLSIDDDVLHVAKQRASEHQCSLGEEINRALRRGLLEDAPRRVSVATLVYGDPKDQGPNDEKLRRFCAGFDGAEPALKRDS